MKRIGLLSDTHGYWDERYRRYFSSCDEIWHAGDIGSTDLIPQLETICPVRAVCGNIDGGLLLRKYPKVLQWQCEEARILMVHIGGYPSKYNPAIKPLLRAYRPHLFISGHSHILKVIHDDQLAMLHINPGAAGKYGWHAVRTLIRFTVDGDKFKDLEVIEL